MRVGRNPNLNASEVHYYEKYYVVLRTPDFLDETRLLKPHHGIKYLGNKNNRRCRFCDKCEPEVSFHKLAHAFPESIGNHALATYYECDECNSFFGKVLENNYNQFFGFFHNVLQISGKRGIPSCNYKVPCEKRDESCSEYCIRMGIDEKGRPFIKQCKNVNSQYISLKKDSILIQKPIGKCVPIAVYKTLVKMALTVMPQEELPLFSETISWIREEKQRNFYKNCRLLIRYKMIPGYNITKYPHYVLYKRRKDVWNKPYILFNLTYGCYSLLIEVPRNNSEGNQKEFLDSKFPPVPFYTSDEGVWDMSELTTKKGECQKIYLSFDDIREVMEL